MPVAPGRNSTSTYGPSTPEDIRSDFTEGKGRPQWILSAYGPGKNPPASLLESNEYSPEEIRARFYELASQGKQDQADQEAITLWNKAQQAMNDVKNDADRVRKFMDDASRNEPNRYSLYKMDGTRTREQLFGSQSSAPTFSAQPSTSAFSALPNNPFGAARASTGFGSTQSAANPFNKPPASTFGQPSEGPSPFGGTTNRSTSTFGQPSFGTQSNPGPFGQAASATAFGQGSLGKPAQTSFAQPVFGSSGFGGQAQNNAFAGPSSANGFGQPQAQPKLPFGTSSQPSGFGKPAFGQPAASSTSQQPVFGQTGTPSAFGPPLAASTSGQSGFGTKFGQPSQSGQQSPFGSNTSTFGNGTFGSSSPAFGSASNLGGFGNKLNAAASNPFGVNANTSFSKETDMDIAASRPASRDTPFGSTTNAPSAFAPAASPGLTTSPKMSSAGPAVKVIDKVPLTYTQTLPKVPPTYDPSGKLLSFRGRRVVWIEDPIKIIDGEAAEPTFSPCYERPDGRGPEKIWFPDGNADDVVLAVGKYKQGFEAPEVDYTKDVEESYRLLHETGQWKDGKMPSVAPRREWVDCDF